MQIEVYKESSMVKKVDNFIPNY